MSISQLKEQLPDYAKDIKLNLSSVLSTHDNNDLNNRQIYGIVLAAAYASKNNAIINAIINEANNVLTAEDVKGIKAAVVIMAMNNIYYRFVHLNSDKDYASMPAKLRMNIITNPGIDKTDFELYSLAVSAINGCGLCIDSHTKSLHQQGMSKLGVQSTIRITAVINALASAMAIE